MPLEELLAIYRYEASAGSSIDSSSGDLTDELPDMTLDKVKNCCYVVMLCSQIHLVEDCLEVNVIDLRYVIQIFCRSILVCLSMKWILFTPRRK